MSTDRENGRHIGQNGGDLILNEDGQILASGRCVHQDFGRVVLRHERNRFHVAEGQISQRRRRQQQRLLRLCTTAQICFSRTKMDTNQSVVF